jgi:hypothetical protein
MLRVLVAGLLGGIGMFIFSGVIHAMTPLDRIDVRELSNDAAVVALLEKASGASAGFFSFPTTINEDGKVMGSATYADKLQTTPRGIIVYQPAGTPEFSLRQLVTEAVIEIAEACLLAFLLRGMVYHAFLSRVALAGVVGVIAAIGTNGAYWNWYGFPAGYTLGQIASQVVGFLIAGLLIATVYHWWRGKPREGYA